MHQFTVEGGADFEGVGLGTGFHGWQDDSPFGHLWSNVNRLFGAVKVKVDHDLTVGGGRIIPFTKEAGGTPKDQRFAGLEHGVVAELGAEKGHLAPFVDFADAVRIDDFTCDLEFLIGPVFG